MSRQLSATQPAINTWLQHFINDKINTSFSYFAILIYSDTTQGKRAEIPYEDDASLWSKTHSHARQTSSFHFQEYFNSSDFGQKSMVEMRHILIQEIKHITHHKAQEVGLLWRNNNVMEIEGVEIRWRMGVYIWSRRSAFTPCHRPVRLCLVVRTRNLSGNHNHTPAAVCTSLESAN